MTRGRERKAMTRGDIEARAQRRVARQYKALGYDVLEQPASELLPAFMQGVRPDIVARSTSDNVVIEVKTPASLKGSNNFVGIAERVSHHPDWRFELVVLGEEERLDRSEADHERLLATVRVAVEAGQTEVAYAFLVDVVVETARHLAGVHGIRPGGKSDRGWFPRES